MKSMPVHKYKPYERVELTRPQMAFRGHLLCSPLVQRRSQGRQPGPDRPHEPR